MRIKRRTFIQIAGGAAAAATVGVGMPAAFDALRARSESHPQTDGERVVPTFCEICFWKCGVLAHVRAGQITKIEGNPDHPLSRGRLCPRGTGGMGLIYDPDRLKTPLIRRDVRGSQHFEPVSWDTALDHVAERMLTIKTKYGPEALALFAHGYGGSWFKRMLRAYGTQSFAAPSNAQCRGAREAGFELTFGSPVGSPENTDLDNARAITLIGNHLGENMHNTQVQWFAEALDRGAELIVVDPRFSVAAGKARHWLPIRPGTDMALLLAFMHVILDEGRYDVDYIDRYAIGLEELKAHVRDKTPRWASLYTGISAEKIVQTARIIAAARPASLIHPGRHTSWYGDDSQRSRAIAILNALLGSWGRKGGFYLPTEKTIPSYPDLPPYPQARPSPEAPTGTVFPFALAEGLAHGLRDASLPNADVPYPIKAWFVYGSNLLQSLPNPEKTRQALEALDLVVAVDVLPAEITGWADVVLPEATYLERFDDLHTPGFREGFAALRQPVVPPLYESKPGWWIAKALAKRLGHGDQFPWDNVEAYLDKRLSAAGTSLSAMQETGVLHDPPVPVYIEDGVEPEFHTPSGKIELHSAQLAEVGLAPMPEYQHHPQPVDGQFRLLFGRTPTHTFGRTTNNRFLSSVYDQNCVWLNAAQARELGLSSGDPVFLRNQDDVRIGPLPVRATEAIRPDCVFMVHGYGHSDRRLRFAHGRGADDNQLCTQVAVDPVMGGTGMNVNFVTIERAEVRA